MGFFKLGKIDKAAEKADKAAKSGSRETSEGRSSGANSGAASGGLSGGLGGGLGGGPGGGLGGGGGGSVDKERSERKKKARSEEAAAGAGGFDVAGPVAAAGGAGGGGGGGGGNGLVAGVGGGGCGGVGGVGGGVHVGGGACGSSAATRPSVNDFISKTKTQQRKGLKPSGPELIAYSRYLGIDPVADHDLLWIAVEALEAPLPSEWTEHFDSNDRVFYYNATTRVSSWTHPLEHVYRETYETIVNFRNCNVSPSERGEKLKRLQLECEQMERDVHREITLWTEHLDEHGHRFYYNSEVRQSTWTDPRPAKCHILYLRMKMIRILETCARNAGVTAAYTEASGKDTHSRFGAPCSPRRDAGAVGPVAEGTKRPKVGGGGGGLEGGDGGSRGDAFFGGGGGEREPGLWPGGRDGGRDRGRESFAERDGGGGGGGGRAAAVAAGVAAPLSSGDGSGAAGGGRCTSPRQTGGGYDDPGSLGETEADDDNHRTVKKKKKKKKRDHSAAGGTLAGADGGAAGGVAGGVGGRGGAGAGGASEAPQRSLQNSMSEPSVGGGNKVHAPSASIAVDEARSFAGTSGSSQLFGGGGGSFDTQSESLSTQGRARFKAGIRLQPLGPGGAPAAAAGGGGGDGANDSSSMFGSSSVPELKHLEKLHLV